MNLAKQLLNILAQNSDFISGQQLANTLNVSRTAIWKTINSLNESGYTIEKKHKSGYRLIDKNKLSSVLIQKYLPKHLKLDFEIHQQLDSTNTQAKKIATLRHSNTPLIILSEVQTAGYGRYGRTFVSPKQTGIYLSILLNNTKANFNPGLLTTAAGLAMYRTILKKLDLKAQIKWVNDILVADKKVCGILTEGISDLENRTIKQIILGCGINYLTPVEDFLDELKPTVGTLREVVLAKKVSRNEFIAAFLSEFFDLYTDYTNASFMNEYRQNCYLLNKQVTISQGFKTFEARVVNVNNLGELVLDSGLILNSGEVTKVRTFE